MLPITYLRSSLINNLTFCEHQMFLTYVLGLYKKSNKKSELGTITHKILELLALCKKELQTKDKYHLIDHNLGLDLIVSLDDLTKPKELSLEEITTINSTRINKETYKWDCILPSKHTRLGVTLVEHLLEKCYQYYMEHSPHKYTTIDFKNVTNFVWITLDYQNGTFDPRKKYIISTETYFDIEIKEDWAKYYYNYRGKELKGNLHLKGTIDLTTKVNDDTYEFVDYKSGMRLDWNTGEIKTYNKLHDDNQLLTYLYAGRHLYPGKNIITSIFFIRDGGPYSICFDDTDIERSIQLFKNTFKKTQNITLPVLLDPSHKNFKCKYICDYYKQTIGNTNTCNFLHNEIQKYGIVYVIDKYTREGFTVDYYENPGE